MPSDAAILSRLQIFERVRARLGREIEGSRGALLRLALAGDGEMALLQEAARLQRLGVRARRRLGRPLFPEELRVLGEGTAVSPAGVPLVVTGDHVASAGEWLLLDASQASLEVTVPASSLGDELRARRMDTSSNQALLIGAFTTSLGPGHALFLKGEPGGHWGAW